MIDSINKAYEVKRGSSEEGFLNKIRVAFFERKFKEVILCATSKEAIKKMNIIVHLAIEHFEEVYGL